MPHISLKQRKIIARFTLECGAAEAHYPLADHGRKEQHMLIEIEREGECHVRVTWMQGAQTAKSRLFDSRDAAESFALAKIGRKGSIISMLDMTADQLRAHEERKARSIAWMHSRA